METSNKNKNIYLVAKNVFVDSGNIFISDKEFYETVNKRKLELNDIGIGSYIFNLPNGKYHVSWEMPNTYHGHVSGEGVIHITTGNIIVSDPCYLIDDDWKGEIENRIRDSRWMKLLEETEYFDTIEEDYDVVLLDRHGGDGHFRVEINLTRGI